MIVPENATLKNQYDASIKFSWKLEPLASIFNRRLNLYHQTETKESCSKRPRPYSIKIISTARAAADMIIT